MDKTLSDLMELGKRLDALPQHIRGYCEPVQDGLKIHLNTIVGTQRWHAQRIISWESWEFARPNPLVIALDALLADLSNMEDPA